MIVTLWIISIISFVVIQLPPGDYLTTLAINLEESGYPVEEAMLERYRIRFGLDKTLFEQYFIWITNFVQGDMGYSFGWKANVNTLIWERLLLTIVLSMSSLILTWLISIPIGVYSALKQHSVGDYAFTILGLAGVSVPSFMLALVLMYLAFSKFGVDVGGLFSPQYEGAPWSLGKMLDLLMHIWLPGFIIAITGTAGLIRTLRANLLDELKKPYIITARSKGVAYRKVVMKYPMRIALNPFISSFAYILPALISGSTIISVVMNMPTTGPLLLGALQTQDMYLAGSFIMLLSVLTVIGTFFSDLLLATIDPRVRFF
jgi:peptide/nickel transport system permease protein